MPERSQETGNQDDKLGSIPSFKTFAMCRLPGLDLPQACIASTQLHPLSVQHQQREVSMAEGCRGPDLSWFLHVVCFSPQRSPGELKQQPQPLTRTASFPVLPPAIPVKTDDLTLLSIQYCQAKTEAATGQRCSGQKPSSASSSNEGIFPIFSRKRNENFQTFSAS